METTTKKSSSLGFWISVVITALVGALLIAWHNDVNLASWIVIAIGALILVPSVVVLVSSLTHRSTAHVEVATATTGHTSRSSSMNLSMTIVSIAAIALGLWMILSPGFFVGLIVYLFAIVLLAYGIYQFIELIYFSRPAVMPWYLYIVPALFVIAGIIILFSSVREINSVVTLITGILLICSAINSTIQAIASRAILRQINRSASETTTTAADHQIEG